MNIPLPVVFILFSFLLPGFFALFFYSKKYEGSVPSDLNWGYGTVLVILFSGITHFALLPFAELIKGVDVESILVLAGGIIGEQSIGRVADSIETYWGWIGLYTIASWCGGSFVGYWSGRLASKLIPPSPADKLFVSENNVWTIVDVLIDPDLLYRGVYHSHRFPAEDQDGYLSLFLVSRWSGKRRAESDPERGDFRAVRRTVAAEEVLVMIRDDLAESTSLDKANQKLVDDLNQPITAAAIGTWVSAYLTDAKQSVPQLSIPWSRIKNLNLRQFESGKPEDRAE